jgi:hypothetical protein
MAAATGTVMAGTGTVAFSAGANRTTKPDSSRAEEPGFLLARSTQIVAFFN